jgi:4-oxalocrotonate tautomerase family enzyme
MPLIQISLKQGYSKTDLIRLMDEVMHCLLSVLHLPANDTNICIQQYDPDLFVMKHPYEIVIRISMFKGRSKETKSALFKSIVNRLHDTMDINPQTVFILIHEEPLENWGIRGGISASESTMDFQIGI